MDQSEWFCTETPVLAEHVLLSFSCEDLEVRGYQVITTAVSDDKSTQYQPESQTVGLSACLSQSDPRSLRSDYHDEFLVRFRHLDPPMPSRATPRSIAAPQRKRSTVISRHH